MTGYLDPGNTNGTFCLPDLLRTTFAVFEQRGSAIRIRLDAAYGDSQTVKALSAAGVGFVLKWKEARTARQFVSAGNLVWLDHAPAVRWQRARPSWAFAPWSARLIGRGAVASCRPAGMLVMDAIGGPSGRVCCCARSSRAPASPSASWTSYWTASIRADPGDAALGA